MCWFTYCVEAYSLTGLCWDFQLFGTFFVFVIFLCWGLQLPGTLQFTCLLFTYCVEAYSLTVLIHFTVLRLIHLLCWGLLFERYMIISYMLCKTLLTCRLEHTGVLDCVELFGTFFVFVIFLAYLLCWGLQQSDTLLFTYGCNFTYLFTNWTALFALLLVSDNVKVPMLLCGYARHVWLAGWNTRE